ncbi:hypothetical protein EDEG_03511 [Edhazardia aedis USNM 41457]|uniref:Uncharacterized protein n=1 Tax=Edhazardia aedis (strain USNM 41457) TaxID=1003232 RepID=J9DHF8_EDHAE|nr:hypothetical protein EDEG_03511 [Edhazardia aedis USNM 41457]|eukprot:EJW02040.1 hypothetical protein EDEG_03511 [Edhazardia aedis USNM 41457]
MPSTATYKQYNHKLVKEVPIFDVDSTKLNETISKYLKQNDVLEIVDNVDIIKTGFAKELPPSDPDWFFKRGASVFRTVVLASMVAEPKYLSLNHFAIKYRSRLDRGCRPNKIVKGAVGHVKAILNSLIKNEWVRFDEKLGYTATEKGFLSMKQFCEQH